MNEQYKIGDKLILVTHHGTEYPVEVVWLTSLPDDLVVKWLGMRPLSGSNAEGINTVCLAQLKEVRRADEQSQ